MPVWLQNTIIAQLSFGVLTYFSSDGGLELTCHPIHVPGALTWPCGPRRLILERWIITVRRALLKRRSILERHGPQGGQGPPRWFR